ncbi:MAG: tetratricopeptide repeat protein [Candidatus Thorarchaeota archaeon]
MYEHYKPVERVFVNRDTYLTWMDEALKRCIDNSVVLHLRGIGGIGKSSLLEHWNESVNMSTILDCDRAMDFFDRLDALAKRAVRLGITLRRFDILWHIRQRFIKGVEPARETGREWAKEILQPIPFIGSLASIGSAINSIGLKLAPRLKGRFGDLGNWLQSRLGKKYVEKLLEVLWKDPRHAEFLYLDAILEDLNNRKSVDEPLLIMLDHFEEIDSTHNRWRYGGRLISEAELWYIFLSSLKNSVGVVASRKFLSDSIDKEFKVEEFELEELDAESCKSLVGLRGYTDEDLQARIVSVSHGNPYVVNSICDLTEQSISSAEDTENLRADTLEEVRLKTWRRLFSQAEGLHDIIDRAGLVTYFNRRILSTIAPSLKSEHWDRLRKLSFVKKIDDDNWVLHDLAVDLVLAELGDQLPTLADEVASLLEKASSDQSNPALLGLSISVRAIVSEKDAIERVEEIVVELAKKWSHTDVLSVLAPVSFKTAEGQAALLLLRGRSHVALRRIAEGEQTLQDALEIYKGLAKDDPEEFDANVAMTLATMAELFRVSNRPEEAEDTYQEALALFRNLAENVSHKYTDSVAETLRELAWLMYKVSKTDEGYEAIREALGIFEKLDEKSPNAYQSDIARCLIIQGALYERRGTLQKSEKVYQKALALYRQLAKQDPDQFQNFVGVVLNNLALLYQQTDRYSEAESVFTEVIEIRRIGVEKAPDTFQRRLGVGLINYGWLLYELNKLDESQLAFDEAYEIFSNLTIEAPVVYQDAVAGCLVGIAALCRDTGRSSEAESNYREALMLYRKLAETAPVLHRHQLAFTLEHLGILLRRTSQNKDAEDAFREGLDFIRDEIEEASDISKLREFTGILRNLAILLRETGRYDEAEDSLIEVIDILRERARDTSGALSRYLAIALNNLAILYRQTDQSFEAENAFEESHDVMRELHEKEPMVYSKYLASILNNMGVQFRNDGKPSDSEEVHLEAIEIKRGLVDDTPDLFQHSLAISLNNYAILLFETNQMNPAEDFFRDACSINEKLFLRAHEMYRSSLKRTSQNLILFLKRMDRLSEIEEINRSLSELGIDDIPDSDVWFEEEEEFD